MLKAQLSAEVLEFRTERRLRRDVELLRKANDPRKMWSIGGVWDRIDVLTSHKPKERKPNATICIAGPGGHRAVIELLPGNSGKHNPRHARDLGRALKRVRRAPPIPIPGLANEYPHFNYIVAKIRWISEFGDIHDFTEDKEDVACQLTWLAYNGNIDRDKYTPFPDLALSDYENYDIYFRAFANYLAIEPFQKIRETIEAIYKRRVFIEQPPDMPGVVRVYPVGNVDHLTEHPAPLPADEDLTTLRFGYAIHGEIGKPIDRDIRSFFNNTHIMTLGASGMGKTNDIGNNLMRIRRMIRVPEERRIVGRCIFVDSEKRAAGLDMYMKGIDCVTEPQLIRRKLEWLHEHYLWRVDRLAELKRADWPIGQTIDGERYTGTILMVDEATALLNEDWVLNIKDPDDDDKDEEEDEEEQTKGKKKKPKKPKGIKLQKLFTYWSRVFRATGILMILYVHKARVNEGIPTGLTDNCLFKKMFHVEDEDMAAEFFNCKAKKFILPPPAFERGVCVIRTETSSTNFIYAKTEKAPHVIAQEKLKVQRGY